MSDISKPEKNIGEIIMTAMKKRGSSGASLEDIKGILMSTLNKTPDSKSIESALNDLVGKGLLSKQSDGKYVLKDSENSRECDTDDPNIAGKDVNKTDKIEEEIRRKLESGKSGSSSDKFVSKSADRKEKSDKATRLEENSETNTKASADSQKFMSKFPDGKGKSDDASSDKFASKSADKKEKSDKTTRLEENSQPDTKASADTQKFMSKFADGKGKSDEATRFEKSSDISKNPKTGVKNQEEDDKDIKRPENDDIKKDTVNKKK